MKLLSPATKRNDFSLFRRGGVAHWLEQIAHNDLVVGSIPTAPTTLEFIAASVAIFLP